MTMTMSTLPLAYCLIASLSCVAFHTWPPPAAPVVLRAAASSSSSSSPPRGARHVDVTSLPTEDGSRGPLPLPRSLRGVVFDMDGTLVAHSIDFAAMRQRIYDVADSDPLGRDLARDCVLALADRLSPDGREECRIIFEDIERRARDEMRTAPGGAELVGFLRDAGIACAVLTRNTDRSAAAMHALYQSEISSDDGGGELFWPIVTRETRSRPDDHVPLRSKPHPDGILHICESWGCRPSDVVMVGDNAHDDVTAANRAGCGGSVLLTRPGGVRLDTHSGYEVGDSEEEVRLRTPSLVVESMSELRACLEALLKERDVGGSGADRERVESQKSNSEMLAYPGVDGCSAAAR